MVTWRCEKVTSENPMIDRKVRENKNYNKLKDNVVKLEKIFVIIEL